MGIKVSEIKYGFTLAEVLITLVIIGVIAAMTIPTLINKTQKQEYVSKLKKSYSAFAQATNKIIADEGTPPNWVTSPENVYNMYKKYLVVAKDCNTESGCISSSGVYQQLQGGSNDYDTNKYRKLVLSDGTIVIFEHESWVSSNCNINQAGSKNICSYFNVDINGAKKPNTVGRDLFLFVIKEDGLYPAGCDTGNCPSWAGLDCACKVLRESAMNY